MREPIPYGRHDISEEDIEAVVRILRSDRLTQGATVPAFEAAVAQRCGAAHAVAMNSATSALHLACLALGIGPGDRVWTSPITFVASANCALYCGAQVDFVDIDPRTYNISVQALEAKLAAAADAGCLPKMVIPVHLSGQSCDMAAIHALGKRFGFRIVEDASHAIGGRYRGEPVGSCRYSDITVFSFHPVKIITSAEGGMALTNDRELAARMARLRTHGITRDPADMTHAPDGPWYYEQRELGYNYRMTDVHAAIGLSQLARIDEFVARRHAIAARYDEALRDLPLTRPWQHPETFSAFHLYIVRLRRDATRKTHAEVFAALLAAGIEVGMHYIPVYRQPFHARPGIDRGDFPEAEGYYAEAMSLPMFSALAHDRQTRVIETLAAILKP
jgi:UDP-4-amino-4,6-dideoxy-N-acetyl-beta-L-altrosamine transaminase